MSRKNIIVITGIIISIMLIVGSVNFVINKKLFESNPSGFENNSTDNTVGEPVIEEDNNDNLDSSDNNVNDEMVDNNRDDSSDNWVKVSIYNAKLDDLTETVLVESMTIGQYTYPLLASIPEENIYLYGADDGVILRHDDLIKPFEWVYLTTRFVLPRLKLEDIDGDGVEEIICILYGASGTGVSIEELHILEPDEDELYRDVLFAPEDYYKQLNELIICEYDEENNKLYYIVDGRDFEYDAPEVFTEYTFEDLIGFGMIVSFDFEDGIRVEDNIAYGFDEITSDVFIDTMAKGKVIYQDESFTITDLIITPPS